MASDPALRLSGAAAPSPFVFVVGCPRSGTTLLQRMLDAHPALAVANDTHFIARAMQAVLPSQANGSADELSPSQQRALIDWACAYHRFARLKLPDAAVSRAAQAETFQGFVSAIYRELAAMQGKTLGGEKTPDYVRSLSLLHKLFPEAKVLHIVRDGRDVALSALEWAHPGKGPGRFALWQEQPLAVCALWWRWQVGSGRDAAAGLPPGVLRELRYETLVHDARGELERIAEFLGIGQADAMLGFHKGKTRHGTQLSAKSAWLPPTAGLRDFSNHMTAAEQALFELLAGDLLHDLGYPTVAPQSELERPETLALAHRCRQAWEQELALGSRRRDERAARVIQESQP